jgi:hypothetical protein
LCGVAQGLSEIKKRRIFPFLSCTPTKKQQPAICQPLLTLL